MGFDALEMIEIDAGQTRDGATRRRLVMVAENGREFIDLIDDPAPLSCPIEAELNPVKVGNAAGWSMVVYQNAGEEAYREYDQLQEFLLAWPGIDSLTYNRALFWAKSNLNFSPLAALEYAEAERRAAWNKRLGFA